MNVVSPSKPDAKRLPSGAEMIAANAYPAVMSKNEAAHFIGCQMLTTAIDSLGGEYF